MQDTAPHLMNVSKQMMEPKSYKELDLTQEM